MIAFLRSAGPSADILRLIGLLGLILGIVVGTTLTAIYRDYQESWQARAALIHDMAVVVEDHAHRVMSSADAGLKRTVDLVKDVGDLEPFRQEKFRTLLLEIAAGMEGGESLFLFDAAGDAVTETGRPFVRSLNVADRPFFHAARAGQEFSVGPAIIARLTGRILFTMTRRLTNPAGKFLGVAVIGVSATRLTDFYKLFDFDLDPLIGIYTPDGQVIARRPDMERWIGSSLAGGALLEEVKKSPSGFYTTVSPLDGRERIAAYTTMRDYGLLVAVALERSVALAAWRTRAYYYGGLAAASAIAIIASIIGGWRTMERQKQTHSMLSKARQSRDIAAQQLAASRLDQLTGIAGRALFLETAQAMVARAAAVGGGVGLLFIDLDGFKGVNDRLGHEAGDQVLRAAARAITTSLRERDVAGRLGGDEFAACIAAPPDRLTEVLCQVAQRIIEQIGLIGEGVGCSIGVASASPQSKTAADILRDADQVMYVAKRAGKNRFVLHDDLHAPAAS